MQQLIITNCLASDSEHLSDLLELCGALSVTFTDQYDDPILEPEPGTVPLWPHIVMQALYPVDMDVSSIIDIVSQQYPATLCILENIVAQNWERVCLDAFIPKCFGKRLWICPSWSTPPHAEAVNIVLDPGLAFGTGSHPTTGLCLTWLDQANITNKTLIDYGCGSGILSIAALKLGASHAYAVDIDEQALTATASNAAINQIASEKLTVTYPHTLNQPVDLIIANILLSPLLDLKHSFYRLLHPHGILTVSGILANQVSQLEEVYQPHFSLLSSEIEHDWALLEFEKSTVDASDILLN